MEGLSQLHVRTCTCTYVLYVHVRSMYTYVYTMYVCSRIVSVWIFDEETHFFAFDQKLVFVVGHLSTLTGFCPTCVCPAIQVLQNFIGRLSKRSIILTHCSLDILHHWKYRNGQRLYSSCFLSFFFFHPQNLNSSC